MRVNLVDPTERPDVQEVDEVVAYDAYVHLEDLGNSYMLIVRDESRHLHLEIPKRRRKGSAWIFEDFHPDELTKETPCHSSPTGKPQNASAAPSAPSTDGDKTASP